MYQPYILKYNYDSLEPHISKKTMELHYNSHYLKYLSKLNDILSKNGFLYQMPKENLFLNIDIFPIQDRDSILYYAGGVTNHELYFSSIKAKNEEIIIPEPLNTSLVQKFGSIQKFMEQFLNLASVLPGSGYTFLVVKQSQELSLINLANQDSPYYYEMIPILAIDVWEHAYYLDYYNDRSQYIEEFMKIIDFDEVNRKYQQILAENK